MNIIETKLQWHGELQERSLINLIVLHHAAGVGTVEQIHQEHINKGWAGIGYNFYVRKDGSIYRGRPENIIGAHCLGYNTNSIGICAEGNFMNEAMPDVQKQAIKELIQYLKSKYKVDIKGHKELNASDCPGTNYPLDELKTVQVEIPIITIDINSFKYLQHEIGVAEDNIPGPITISKCPIIKISANNNIVRWLQAKLAIAVDGIFGRQTLIAVQNFQAKNGLVADGIVGPKTWRKLLGL